VLFKKVWVLLGAVMMVLSMFAASAPAFAQPEKHPGAGSGATDPNPGRSEGSDSHLGTPPAGKPGNLFRSPTAGEHDQSDPRTGRGKRNDA
jgi:hypothetical protein